MPDNNRAKKRRKNRNNKRKIKNQNDPGNICDTDKQSLSSQMSGLFTNDEKLEQIVAKDNVKDEKDLSKLQDDVFLLRDEVNALCAVKESEKYKVESPTPTLKHKDKTKLQNLPKSKSLDNDEDDQINIVEITEDTKSEYDRALAIIESNAIVSEAESDVEWEVTGDLLQTRDTVEGVSARGTLSIETLALDLADCENTQTLSPDEELSLRQYLQTLNLVTCPQDLSTIVCNPDDKYKQDVPKAKSEEKAKKSEEMKKTINKEFVLPVPAKSRFLEVIDEEGSNESGDSSRRHSYLPAHQLHECSDLEDDVFYDKSIEIKKCFDRFPGPIATRKKLTEQERTQKCVLVGAKVLQVTPKEGCSTWRLEMVDEKNDDAEIVYLEDSSSSASEVCDEASDEGCKGDEEVRIHTPIIEIDSNKGYASQCPNNLDTLTLGVFAEESITKDVTLSDTKTPPPTPTNTILDDKAIERNTTEITDNYVSTKIQGDTPNVVVTVPEEPKRTSDEKLKVEKPLDTMPKDSQVSEIDALKEELNSALMNLVQTISDEKLDISTSFSRQDSLSSVSSQSTTHSTAKYNPTRSSLTDITTVLHGEIMDASKTETESSHNHNELGHVKEVIKCVSGIGFDLKTCATHDDLREPEKLKDICLKTISCLSCGPEILEELANVAKELQNINLLKGTDLKASILKSNKSEKNSLKMPYYPSPDLSTINKVIVPKKQAILRNQEECPEPPFVMPRNSSLNVSVNDPAWVAVKTNKDPSMFMCISPSQKHLIDITKTKIDEKEASQLIDLHKKYVGRRGCREYFSDGYDSETSTVGIKNRVGDYKDDTFFEVNRSFKSPSGNRLLAIIRESSVTPHNEFKHPFKETSRSCDYLNERKYSNGLYNNLSTRRSESCDYRLNNNVHYLRDVPVPPPRSRAYSATIYESDESSDYTDYSHKSNAERKRFYYSMDHLFIDDNQENASHLRTHRRNVDGGNAHRSDVGEALNEVADKSHRRRLSLPQSMNEKQMKYILKKEKLVKEQIERLETEKKSYFEAKDKKGPRAPLMSEEEYLKEDKFDSSYFQISRQRDIAVHCDKNTKALHKNPIRAPTVEPSEEEKMREKMYSEYMEQVAERAERKQHKVIKITSCPLTSDDRCISKSLPQLHNEIRQACNAIEDEFINKAKERWQKLGIHDPETEDERDNKETYKPMIVEQKIKVIEEGQEKDVKRLPSHLREFVQFTAGDKSVTASPGEPPNLFVIMCAVLVIIFSIGKRLLPILRTKNQ